MASRSLPHPLLVADLGGTNARFAIVERPGDPPGPMLRLATADFAGPETAFAQAIAHFGVTPGSALVAAAGPRQAGTIALTNATWTLDIDALCARFGCNGVLFNDFEAVALALPFLRAEAIHPIGSWKPTQNGVRIVMGPGTGLGVGALIETEGRFLPLASEAAHSGFGPLTRDEERLFKQVERVDGRLTAEVLLSGPGLARLHAARMALQDRDGDHADAAIVTNAALANPEGEAAATVRLFLALLARFAGDLAISVRAQGGVFIAGGIVPRLIPLLDPKVFRMNFEAKAPVAALAASCPSAIILGEAALIGMAAFAAQPDRFMVAADGRIV